jgi:hypothetical protein
MNAGIFVHFYEEQSVRQRLTDSTFKVTQTVHATSGTPLSLYRGSDKSLARPTSRCILFDGENISSCYVYK